MIDLMDEGDNYVSNYCPKGRDNPNPSSSDLHVVRPTTSIGTTICTKNSDAQLILTVAGLLNNSQQFNYEREKIDKITDENEYLFELATRVECIETSTDEKSSTNDERRFIFIDNVDAKADTENEIRLKGYRQPGSHASQTQSKLDTTKCEELDNCFFRRKSTSMINGKHGAT